LEREKQRTWFLNLNLEEQKGSLVRNGSIVKAKVKSKDSTAVTAASVKDAPHRSVDAMVIRLPQRTIPSLANVCSDINFR